MTLSAHARQRMQSRGIPEKHINFAVSCGCRIDGRNEVLFAVGSREFHRGPHRQAADLLGLVVVVDKDCKTVITAYRNTKWVKRNLG
jgi:hypothetical protein